MPVFPSPSPARFSVASPFENSRRLDRENRRDRERVTLRSEALIARVSESPRN